MMIKKLVLGKLTINKPEDWAEDEILIEINDYDYDSTILNIQQIEDLRNYINEILKIHKK